MLNACVSCPVITAQCCMLVFVSCPVIPVLYVKCLCELSRYHSPVRGLLDVKCLCELSRYHSPVEEFCYMLNVCASCPVITAQ